MESLTRLVTESLARHGFDRPLDYRRLRWSRWFRCESHHSLLLVPSKPGVFALAEQIVDFGSGEPHVGTAALGFSAEQSPASGEERRFSAASSAGMGAAALAAAEDSRKQANPKRMLAVTEFFEADDMAFVLDRMLARQNPMRDDLNSGRYFIRFVVIEDAAQRRSVHGALNQWIAENSITNQSAANHSLTDSAEQASGIAAHFAGSLELTPATEYVPAAMAAQSNLFENVGAARTGSAPAASKESIFSGDIKTPSISAQQLDSGAATNIHCPSPLPSGF
jgi:hypothetical protein